MRSVRILLVSKNVQLAAALKAGLAPYQMEVLVYENLLGLYPVLLREEPDVVVLDGDLPRLALEAAARFLRSKDASRRQPVLLLTGSGEDSPDPGLLAAACQADDFLDAGAEPARIAASILRLSKQAAGPFDAIPDTGEARVAAAPAGTPRILIVDDDVAIARLLRRMLEARYAVSVVNDGKTAIERCRATRFDAVFCDLMMAGVSGADVYRAVRAHDAALADHIVFITAHEFDAAEVEFFMGLSNQIVHKPFSLRDVLAVAATVTGSAGGLPKPA